MSIRSRFAVATIVGLFALTGCVPSGGTPTPTPSTSTSSAEPTPSATPDAAPVTCDTLVPESVFDGADLERGPLAGQAQAAASTVLGGISCLWALSQLQVAAYPLESAPEELRDRFADPVCDGWGYDGRACYASGMDGGYWFIVAVGVTPDIGGPSEPDAAQIALLTTLSQSVAGGIRSSAMPEPAIATAEWWAEPACDEFTTSIEWPWPMEDFAGQGYPFESGSSPVTDVVDANGSLTDCLWTDDGDGTEEGRFTSTQAQVVPGGGAAGMPEGVEGEPVDVAGADSALLHVGENDLINLAVIDGPNFVEITFQSSPTGASAPPIGSDRVIAFAGRLLEALNG